MGTFVVSEIMMSSVLLLVRVVLVVVFVVSARKKLRDVPAFAKKNGIVLPLVWVVVLGEAAAALGMATGVLAQWAGVGVVLLMMSTIYMHVVKWKSPYWASKGGWEYDVLLLVLAAVIVVAGPGHFVLFG